MAFPSRAKGGVWILPALTIIGIVGAGLVVPDDAMAQSDCLLCSPCVDPAGAWGHKAIPDPEGVFRGPSHSCGKRRGDMTCEDHRLCRPTGNDDLERLASLIDTVVEAVDGGDIWAAYMVARNQPAGSRLYYSPERTAIQALGCSGAVILHIPIPLPLVVGPVRLAAAFDRVVWFLGRGGPDGGGPRS